MIDLARFIYLQMYDKPDLFSDRALPGLLIWFGFTVTISAFYYQGTIIDFANICMWMGLYLISCLSHYPLMIAASRASRMRDSSYLMYNLRFTFRTFIIFTLVSVSASHAAVGSLVAGVGMLSCIVLTGAEASYRFFMPEYVEKISMQDEHMMKQFIFDYEDTPDRDP